MAFTPLPGDENNGGNAYARLWVDMTEEQPDVHQNNPRLKRDTMWLEAKLLINRPPEAETWLKAMIPEEWPDALLDVAGQWYRRMMGPTDSVPVDVTWHAGPGFAGTLEVVTSVHDSQTQPIGNGCTGHVVDETSIDGKITIAIDGDSGSATLDRVDSSSHALKGECPALGGLGSCHVGRTHPTDPVEESRIVESVAHGSAQVQVGVSIDTQNGTYVIGSQTPNPPITVTRTSYSLGHECNGPVAVGPKTESETLPTSGELGSTDAQGVLDPNNPDVLEGSIGPDDNGTTTTWHLTR
jgi:hypothetical protein